MYKLLKLLYYYYIHVYTSRSLYLAHVDVIIRMDRYFTSQLTSECLIGSVTDDLINIHVSLSSRSGLPDHQREVIIERSSTNLTA